MPCVFSFVMYSKQKKFQFSLLKWHNVIMFIYYRASNIQKYTQFELSKPSIVPSHQTAIPAVSGHEKANLQRTFAAALSSIQLVVILGDYTRDQDNMWPHFHPAKRSPACVASTAQA